MTISPAPLAHNGCCGKLQISTAEEDIASTSYGNDTLYQFCLETTLPYPVLLSLCLVLQICKERERESEKQLATAALCGVLCLMATVLRNVFKEKSHVPLHV